MSNSQNRAIRFRLAWHGRQPGDVDNQMDFGVKQTLVTRGFAEWVDTANVESSAKLAVQERKHRSFAKR